MSMAGEVPQKLQLIGTGHSSAWMPEGAGEGGVGAKGKGCYPSSPELTFVCHSAAFCCMLSEPRSCRRCSPDDLGT